MALQMVFIEPTPPSSSSEMVVAASSSSLVSEQNALAQTLMNLSGNQPSSSSASSAAANPQQQGDPVPSSTGSEQFGGGGGGGGGGGSVGQFLPAHKQTLLFPPMSATPPPGSSSPSLYRSSVSPMKDSSPYPSSPGKQFYKNKRKAYPVRSPHVEHRQSPPGIVFQFPSVFMKEGSEHLSPKLNVIFYPEATPSSPKSPQLQRSSPAASTSAAAAAAAANARSRASARAKTSNTRLQSLSGDQPKSKRRLKESRYDESESSSEDEQQHHQGSNDEDDIRGAEQLASLMNMSKSKPRKRKIAPMGDDDTPKKPKKPRVPRKDKVPTIQVTVQNPDGSYTTTEVPGERPRRAKLAAHDALAHQEEGRGGNSEEGDLSDVSGDGDTETGGKEAAGGSHDKPKMAVPKPGSSKKVCASCGTTNTPYWRDGWHTCTLCNACGIRYQKYKMRCLNCIYIPRKEETSNPRCSRCGHTMSR